MKVHIDFETRSVADLPLVGSWNYAKHPSTQVICIAYTFGSGEIKLWVERSAPPTDLIEAAINPAFEFHAFNVGFERRIWDFVLHKRMGWPPTTIDKWYDTQADAFAMGLPGHLKGCAQALHVKFKKDASGTRLINRLSKPIKKGGTEFRQVSEFPQDFFDFYEYCKQDVRAERAVSQALTVATTSKGQEREIWKMTEEINDAGVPVDYGLAQAFTTMVDVDLKGMVSERLVELTDGNIEDGNSPAKMNAELIYPLKDFTKATVAKALSCPALNDHDRIILEARQMFGNTSTAKYPKMVASFDGGWVRDILQYHAAATGRYGGRGIQIQNFPRWSPKNAEAVARDAKDLTVSFDEFEERYGSVQDVAKSMLRPTLCAPMHHTFICYDYSSIEAVGTAWATKDENQLEVFRSGKDIYIATAAEMYEKTYDSIGKDDPERQAGKIAVLACGYQGGWKALRDFAIGYDVFWTPKESYKIVHDFRRARPRLVNAWNAFDNAAMAAIRNPGKAFNVDGCEFCEFKMVGKHLRMVLPNGKFLWFPFAERTWVRLRYTTHEGEEKMLERFGVTHMWTDNGRWIRRSIHGGSLFQSYVQAICREIIMEAMLRIRDAGWPLNMQVHDEIASVVKMGSELDDPQRYHDIMVEVPTWANGFVIRASGWVGRRYRK